MSDEQLRDTPGYVLGTVLIGILLALLIAAFGFGLSTDRPTPPGMGPVFMGLFLVALALMFLASYFVASRSFFLRWLLKLSMAFPFAQNRGMALLLFAVCILSGVGAIARGLGFDFP